MGHEGRWDGRAGRGIVTSEFAEVMVRLLSSGYHVEKDGERKAIIIIMIKGLQKQRKEKQYIVMHAGVTA